MIHSFESSFEAARPDYTVVIDHRGGSVNVIPVTATPERGQYETQQQFEAHTLVLRGVTAARANAIVQQLEAIAIADGTLTIPTVTFSQEEVDRAAWSGEQLSYTPPRPSQVSGAGAYRLTSTTTRRPNEVGDHYIASPNWAALIDALSNEALTDTSVPQQSYSSIEAAM